MYQAKRPRRVPAEAMAWSRAEPPRCYMIVASRADPGRIQMASDASTFGSAGVDGFLPPSLYRSASRADRSHPADHLVSDGALSVRSSSSLLSSVPSTTYSNLKNITAMSDYSSAEDTPAYAANACACCRSQKRRCDKKLPSCSRCTKTKTNCNYHWDQAAPQVNPQMSIADFLLFHIPVTSEHMWLPGTFESLHPYHPNIQARGLDLDWFFGGLVMTAVVEQNQSLTGALDSYFGNIHPWLPVIHEQIFRERASQLGVAPGAEVALIFLAMLLVLEGPGSSTGKETSQSQLYNLCRYLFSFLQISRSPSLELVQAGLLLVIYELGSGRSQAASLSIGACARLGYVLGLNVDSPQQLDIDWVRAEEQRRVWLGVYMLDRLTHQVGTNPFAPHAVEELPLDYRLPMDDCEWDRPQNTPSHEFFQPAFSTPIHIPLCYFAREIQAIRILGQVQMLSKITNSEMLLQQMDVIDSMLMKFMEQLFDQTPGSWKVLCGANAIALMAAIILHYTRLNLENKDRGSSFTAPRETTERSLFALCSVINMVRDICARFSALDEQRKLGCVPLPSLICTVEAARIAMWLNQILPGLSLDIGPFHMVIEYAAQSWGAAGIGVVPNV
ncbi:fungal-specific transcription factor domain-containing protein [Aspergillus granulosus]|uniref:Fungal-specific transcription factor domain-containing protein n=1 Tax=Aspergillus granulosus TaxID=176169 RepID=A0ABR4H4D4_9EURO